MRGRRHPSRPAFTLIEIVVSLAVLGFVATVASAIFFERMGDYYRVANRRQALDQVRLAMERMIREIRHVADNDDDGVPDITAVTGSGRTASSATYLDFDRRSGAGVVFRAMGQDPTGSLPGLLLWTESANGPFALLKDSNVTIAFTYFKGDGTTATPDPGDASWVNDVRRISIQVQLPVADSRLAQAEGVSEAPVTLVSSCYIRNMAGEMQ
jgi:prepilin-type N-terminal cleavage/methylation domain-containing protein